MVGSNLPPGVTASDIDKHFGEPDTHREVGEVIYDVCASDPIEPREVLDVSGGEVVHSEMVEEDDDGEAVYAVYIGAEVQTQFDSQREIVSALSDAVSVSTESEAVEGVQYIDVRQ